MKHKKDKPNLNFMVEAFENLQKAEGLRQAGKPKQSAKICEELLKKFPDFVGALHTYGLAMADLNKLSIAVASLGAANALNPKDWRTATALSSVYIQMGAHAQALNVLSTILEEKPNDVAVLLTFAQIKYLEKEYEEAAVQYKRVTELEASFNEGWLGLGKSLENLGDSEGAIQAYETAINQGDISTQTLLSLALQPRNLVHLNISDLVTTLPKPDTMKQEEYANMVAFSKAAILANSGKKSEAWKALLDANEPIFQKGKAKYLNDRTKRLNHLAQSKNYQVLKKPIVNPKNIPVSLFIFGPSRSGKTTTEKLFGRLPGVKRGFENPIIYNSARRTHQEGGLPTRNLIAELPLSLDKECRDIYIEELLERAPDTSVFTNTHPGRILDAYRMAAIIPNAKFVFVKRDINDIAFKMFGKLYGGGNYYSYDIAAAHEYASWYADMQNELLRLLPASSMEIEYEALVENPVEVLNEIGKFCGIDGSLETVEPFGHDVGCSSEYIDLINQRLDMDSLV